MNGMYGVLPYAGQVLLLAVLLTLILGRFVNDSRRRLGLVAVLLALGMFLPVSGSTIAQWLRSVSGDLSVLTLVIFSNILAQRLFHFKLVQSTSIKPLLLGVAVVGVVFYPMALGVSAFDPYRLGYAPVLMSALLCLASIIAWLSAKRDLAIILLLPLIACNLHLLESGNLWDYLLDPILWVYAFVQSVISIKLSRLNKVGSTT
jgi:hypothetical protein